MSAKSSVQAQGSGEGTSLSSTEVEEDSVSHDEPLPIHGECWGQGYRPRRVRAKGAVLVLLWNVAMSLE